MRARRAYAAVIDRLAADPTMLGEYQEAARAWREVDVDEDGWPNSAPGASRLLRPPLLSPLLVANGERPRTILSDLP
jgi:hypothetical protein